MYLISTQSVSHLLSAAIHHGCWCEKQPELLDRRHVTVSAESQSHMCPWGLSAGEGSSSSTSSVQTSVPLQGTPFKPGSITTKGKPSSRAPSTGSSCWNRGSVPTNTALDVWVSIFKPEIGCKALIYRICQDNTPTFMDQCVCGSKNTNLFIKCNRNLNFDFFWYF